MELASCVQPSFKEEGDALSSAHKAPSQTVALHLHGVADRLGNASTGGSGNGGGGGQQRCQSAPLALTTHERSPPSPGASGPKRKRAATPEAQELLLLLQSSRTGPLNLSKAPRRDEQPEGRNDGGLLSPDGRRSVPPATSLRRPGDSHSGGGGGADLAATPGCHGDGPSATPCCHGAGTSWPIVPADDVHLHHRGTMAVLQQQMRPSVITCAPALNQKNHHGSRHALRGPNKSHKRGDVPSEPSDATAVSDPVIEEHFRRSLGKDYREADSVSITGSVDDHFAKALGDAWFQLKTTAAAAATATTGRRRVAPTPASVAATEAAAPGGPPLPAPSPSPASTDASGSATASGSQSDSDAEEGTPAAPRVANHAAPGERVATSSPPEVS
ncbi:uncharacterized protein LOC116947498 [Petromyzon marinus]|uniref:uncharacterized protein LOC116947498 n=1 Tax=Petromyzon marinus TaxID=7757 RepID=UPI003F6F7DEE